LSFASARRVGPWPRLGAPPRLPSSADERARAAGWCCCGSAR